VNKNREAISKMGDQHNAHQQIFAPRFEYLPEHAIVKPVVESSMACLV